MAVVDKIVLVAASLLDIAFVVLRGFSDHNAWSTFVKRQPNVTDEDVYEEFNVRCFQAENSIFFLCLTVGIISLLCSVLSLGLIIKENIWLRRIVVIGRFINLSFNSNLAITASYYFFNECVELWDTVEPAFMGMFIDTVIIYNLVIKGEYLELMAKKEV